jgi:RHH-type transcriptional regulator, rel operon repressor / antitoxin RelB
MSELRTSFCSLSFPQQRETKNLSRMWERLRDIRWKDGEDAFGVIRLSFSCYTCIAMLAIRLTPGIEKRLERLAKKTGRTKTHYAREAILAYLEDMEDLAVAERRWADVVAGKTKLIPHEEAMKRLGLETRVRSRRPARVEQTRPNGTRAHRQVSARKARAA